MSLIDPPAAPSLERLTGEIVAVERCSADERAQMLALMDRYYDNVTEAGFLRDLEDKDWVILARRPSDRAIVGFSTQTCTELRDGRRALFSGDTIVDRPYWRANPITGMFGRLALTIHDVDQDRELLWFLISKGYKTYRFLPLFFREFFPRVDADTPAWASDALIELGTSRYPDRFDPKAGVVRAGPNDERLKPDVAELDVRRRKNPDVAYFERRNPGHRQGDELCCVARLSRDNFTPVAHKLIGKHRSIRLERDL